MKKERCVVCGKETDIDVETHIDLRVGYVEGTGQLCPECDAKIYSRKVSNVDPEECETCRFFPDNCHFWNNKGVNLSFLITNPDGTCSKRQPREEARVRSG